MKISTILIIAGVVLSLALIALAWRELKAIADDDPERSCLADSYGVSPKDMKLTKTGWQPSKTALKQRGGQNRG